MQYKIVIVFADAKKQVIVHDKVSIYNVSPEDGYVRIQDGPDDFFYNWDGIELFRVTKYED